PEPKAERRLHDPLYVAARKHPAKVALIVGDEQLTYAALCDRVQAIASRLESDVGIAPGDPVLFLTTRKIDFIAAFYACAMLGAIGVPVPEGAARDTVLDMADASGAKVLVADGTAVARFSPAIESTGFWDGRAASGASAGIRVVLLDAHRRNV